MAQRPQKTPYKLTTSADELLERYASGERHFMGALLRAAMLARAHLTGAILIEAHLIEANLSGANLSGANLTMAHLMGANLDGANLSGANLASANLDHANLSSANLEGAILNGAILNGAILNNTTFNHAKLENSKLGGISLKALCQATPPVVHYRPSSIDFESITLSLLAPNLEDFLIRAGLPPIAAQAMIDAAQAVKGSVWDMMQSTFISFGGPDELFARKLYEALHSNGVRTFFFPEHAEPGEKLHRMMRDGVNKHDRVILICSKSSLDRKGVLNEIEETLAREARDGGEAYLIPIRLDDYVFSGWKPSRLDVAQAIRDRVVADFTEAMTDQAKFDAALSKLLRALRVKNTAPTTP
jgi:uncharacterized protein YjbI with pentapeptide repeats